VRSINTAEISYNAAYPDVGFAGTLAAIGSGTSGCTPSSASGCFIDSVLTTGTKSGYSFAVAAAGGTPATSYYVTSNPVTANQTGVRSFCSYEDAVVRYSTAAISGSCPAATAPLQ
jgi:hypothetical protein